MDFFSFSNDSPSDMASTLSNRASCKSGGDLFGIPSEPKIARRRREYFGGGVNRAQEILASCRLKRRENSEGKLGVVVAILARLETSRAP